MGYFTKDFISFFKELAANNHKDWFDVHRKRYKESVKDPFEAFVKDMIIRINADDPDVLIQPKDGIFRINRDIRFSADKRPYKTHMSAIISAAGRKDKGYPGIYIQLGAEGVRIYGGAHMLEKENLYKVRQTLANQPGALDKLLAADDFKAKFGGIMGEKNKKLPPEFKEAAEKQPLIFNKQFYYGADLPAKHITSDTLGDTIMEYYFAAKPVKEFLTKAIYG